MQEYIFELNVPVNDVLFVQGQHRRTDLIENTWYFLLDLNFIKNVVKGKVWSELSVQGALHDDVEVYYITEEAVDFYYVWIVEIDLDLQLSNELRDHFALYYVSLLNYL